MATTKVFKNSVPADEAPKYGDRVNWELPRIPRDRIDHNGFVQVYDLTARKWKRVTPIDAREQMKLGTSTLEPEPNE